MDQNMLKCLVELANNTQFADVKAFFMQYPNDDVTRKGLTTLKQLGFINVVWASGDIQEISLSQKALDLF